MDSVAVPETEQSVGVTVLPALELYGKTLRA